MPPTTTGTTGTTGPRRLPRLVASGACVLAALVVLVLSHGFGRAQPTDNYRPLLPPAALDVGCFPLPGGASLAGLPHQVRRDGDVETDAGPRRLLRGQYDLVDAEEALRRIVAAFAEVGLIGSVDLAAGTARLTSPDGVEVGVEVAALPGTSEETLVRGTFELDLPVVAAAYDEPVCRDPKSTKRWDDPR